jgi:hypothetical protein
VCLLLHGRPAHIAGLIVPVVVDTIQSCLQWTFAHIGKKILELSPPFANRDASAAIIREVFKIRIPTTIKHLGPACVSWISNASPILSMLRIASKPRFPAEAAATQCPSANKIIAPNDRRLPAIANTIPSSLIRWAGVEGNNG